MASTNTPATGHQRIETSNFLMIVLVLLTVLVGGRAWKSNRGARVMPGLPPSDLG